MKFARFLACLTGVTQVVQSLEAPIEGYEVAELGWEVQTSPDGPLHQVNGTIQEVVQYLKEIDPTYEVPEVAVPELESRHNRIDARQASHKCFGFPTAAVNPIQDGINYLHRVPGKPGNGPGPGACGRVSCSNNAAIWWCNDNRFTFTLDSYKIIANAAQYVKQSCQKDVSGRGTETSGQGFFDGNWNVIIRGSSC